MSSLIRPAFGVLLLLTALASVGSAQAQGLKIAVFDKQRIVDESKLGLGAKRSFESLQSAREQEVAQKQKAFEQLQSEYSQKASILTDDKKLELQRGLARARDEWQSSAQNADRDLQRAYESALIDIVTKVDPVISTYGKDQGYDFLFDISQVAFAQAQHDITAALIAKIDSMYAN